MTNDQKQTISNLQKEGKGYRTIAAETGLPLNSVKSWCRRHPANGPECGRCRQCGAAIIQTPGSRAKVFCSDACRYAWWTDHPEKRSRRTTYGHTCAFCGKEFYNERILASYCSRACFAKARSREAAHE